MAADATRRAVRTSITGLVLAGGQGSRMGGQDKGLQWLGGQPLAWHVLQKLRPQVGAVALNANRHLAEYAALGAPVWPDTLPDFPGPLAGFLVGLQRATSPWLVTVPCDGPVFPHNLVERLYTAADEAHADIAIAGTRHNDGTTQTHPVFSLMRTSLADSVANFVAAGGRKVGQWQSGQACAVAMFDRAEDFFNANTPADLAELAHLSARVEGRT